MKLKILNFYITSTIHSTFIHNLLTTNTRIKKVFQNTQNSLNYNEETVKGELVNDTFLDQDNKIGKISKMNTSLPTQDFLTCFSNVKTFLQNNPSNNKTQKEQEKYLYDKSVEFSLEKNTPFLVFPTELRKKVVNGIPE